jgi:hypothetical protein
MRNYPSALQRAEQARKQTPRNDVDASQLLPTAIIAYAALIVGDAPRAVTEMAHLKAAIEGAPQTGQDVVAAIVSTSQHTGAEHAIRC